MGNIFHSRTTQWCAPSCPLKGKVRTQAPIAVAVGTVAVFETAVLAVAVEVVVAAAVETEMAAAIVVDMGAVVADIVVAPVDHTIDLVLTHNSQLYFSTQIKLFFASIIRALAENKFWYINQIIVNHHIPRTNEITIVRQGFNKSFSIHRHIFQYQLNQISRQ